MVEVMARDGQDWQRAAALLLVRASNIESGILLVKARVLQRSMTVALRVIWGWRVDDAVVILSL